MHLPDHLGAGVDERLVALVLPLRGADLVRLLRHVDVGLELPHELVDVAAHVVEVHLAVEQHPLGVDHEGAAQGEARGLVVDAEHPGDLPGGVGGHGVLDVRELFLALLPGQVDELGVGAHRDDVAPHLHEPVVLLCQSSELGRSNEGEVGRVEEEDRPALAGDLVGERELPEVVLHGVVGGELEVGDLLPQLEPRRIGHAGHLLSHGSAAGGGRVDATPGTARPALPAARLQPELVEAVLERLQALALARLHGREEVRAVEQPRREQDLGGELRLRPQPGGGLVGIDLEAGVRPRERHERLGDLPHPVPEGLGGGLAVGARREVGRDAREEAQLEAHLDLAAPLHLDEGRHLPGGLRLLRPGAALGRVDLHGVSRAASLLRRARLRGLERRGEGSRRRVAGRRLHELAGPGPRFAQRPALAVDGDERDQQAARAGAALLGGPQHGDGLVGPPRRVQADGVRVGVVRGPGVELGGAAELGQGLARALAPHEKKAERVVHRGVRRVHLQGAAQDAFALVVAALQPEEIGEVHGGGEEPRREPQRRVVVPPGLLEPSPPHVDDAEVHVRLGALGVGPLRQEEVVERAVEGGPLLRGQLGVRHVGERRDRLHPHRPHRVPQQVDADAHPLLRGKRLECRGRPQPHQRVGVPGRLLQRGQRLGPEVGGQERHRRAPHDPRLLRVADHVQEERLRPRLEGAARVEGERVVRLLLLPAGVPPPHRPGRPLRRAVAVAVVAGVRGVLPAERDGEVRPRRAERVVVPRVDAHVGLGPQVAGHAGGALPVLPVEVVLAAGEALGLVAGRAHVVRPRP